MTIDDYYNIEMPWFVAYAQWLFLAAILVLAAAAACAAGNRRYVEFSNE